MTQPRPAVLIGLDAAELSLVEDLCAAGRLPALESIRQRGCFGTLESNATLFAGGVWPTFYTSKELPWHGLYHNLQWHRGSMRCEPPSEVTFPERPFWERLRPGNYRLAVLDVPMTVGQPKPLNGIQLAGWGAHDLSVRGSSPADLWRRLERDFGRPRMPPENYGPQSAAGLLQLKRELLDAAEQMATVSKALLGMEAWNLFLVVFGSAHRGGHYLWDLSQIEAPGLTVRHKRMLEQALAEVYQALDYAIGRVLQSTPHGARVMVFSLHGMGRNPGWTDRYGDVLERIECGRGRPISMARVLGKLNPMLPRRLIRPITRRLPPDMEAKLVSLWYGSMVDTRVARCFPLLADQAGYIRINLKGREPRGIVEPGPEYEALCQEVKRAFLSFRDILTDELIVERVYHVDELAPRDAPYRDALPDLVITWGEVSAIDSPGVRSEQYGEIRWHPAHRLPSGRAGNHRPQGWFVAAGDGIEPGTRADGHRLIELAPTVCHWVGAEQQPGFQGRPISALCD